MATKNYTASNLAAGSAGGAVDLTGPVVFAALAPSLTGQAGGAVDLTVSTKSFTATLTGTAAGAAAATVGTPIQFTATLTGTGGGAVAGVLYIEMSAHLPPAVADGSVTLSSATLWTATLNGLADGSVTPTVSGQGMTIRDVVEATLALYGMCCDQPTLDDCLLTRIISDINAAHQLIYSKAAKLDYFNRDTLTVTIGTGGSLALDDSIQNVCDDVRFAATGHRRLALCTTQQELDEFVDAVYGGTAPAAPRAYFVDAGGQTSGDSVGLVLKVSPVPSGNTDFLVDVSLEPQRYEVTDINLGTPVQMPHRYAELILLPIVRKWASRDRRFTRREQQPEIDEQYAAARKALGDVEPATPAEREARTPAKNAPQ